MSRVTLHYFPSTNDSFLVIYFINILRSVTVGSNGVFLTNFMKQNKKEINPSSKKEFTNVSIYAFFRQNFKFSCMLLSLH